MAENPEYFARIRQYVEGKDPLEIQQQTPSVLADLMAGLDSKTLQQRPSPDKWSVSEIITHLAEDEIATAWRYRQMVENPGVQLASFNQDIWCDVGNYRERDARQSCELFRLLRENNLAMLKRLSEQQMDSHGVHAERGRITVRELAKHMAGHDQNHVDQIRRILDQEATQRKAS